MNRIPRKWNRIAAAVLGILTLAILVFGPNDDIWKAAFAVSLWLSLNFYVVAGRQHPESLIE